MLIKLLNNTGHDATNWSYTSITAHHYTSASVSSISFISFISMRIPPSTSSRLRLYNISFKWIFSNIESRIIPSKRYILLYESNQHLFPRACKMSNPISQHSYRDCMMSNNISLTEFFFLEWWFKNNPQT